MHILDCLAFSRGLTIRSTVRVDSLSAQIEERMFSTGSFTIVITHWVNHDIYEYQQYFVDATHSNKLVSGKFNRVFDRLWTDLDANMI